MDLTDLINVKVTTASKSEESVQQTPATVRVITADMIRDRGYMSLEDALSDVPGIQFRNIVGFNSYVFMRGLPNQNNLILLMIDGVIINELNSGGFYGGLQYNLCNVKQIEIVYGPASAMYGTNSISGIINLITYDPDDNKAGLVSGTVGRFNTKFGDFRYSHSNADTGFGYSISGTAKKTDKADLRGAKGDNNWSDQMENFEDDVSVDGKISFKRLKAGFVFQDKQSSRTTNYKSVGTDYQDFGTNWHIRFINLHAMYESERHHNWSFQTMAYYRNASVLDDTVAFILTDPGEHSGEVGYYRPNHLFGVETRATFTPSARMRLLFGFVWEREKLAESFSLSYSGAPDISPEPPAAPPSQTNDLLGMYAQLHYRLSGAVEVVLGVRHDDSTNYGNVDTPRTAIIFHGDRWFGRLTYMEAFRAPKPWDYTFGIGNPGLQPETMKSFEASGGYTLSGHSRIELALYHNRISQIFEKEIVGDNQRWVNSGDATVKGLELSYQHVVGETSTYVNYTFTDAKDESGDQLPEISKHVVNLGTLYRFTDQWKLNLAGHFIGKRWNPKLITATETYSVGAAFTIDATLTAMLKHNLTAQLIGRNLLDTKYYHTSNRPPDRYRQPQRSLYLRITWRF